MVVLKYLNIDRAVSIADHSCHSIIIVIIIMKEIVQEAKEGYWKAIIKNTLQWSVNQREYKGGTVVLTDQVLPGSAPNGYL